MKKIAITLFITAITLLLSSGSNYPAGSVILTFDDGPNPKYTPHILQTLKESDIKAIFFVVGQEAFENPEILAEINNHNHLIGNHTYSHNSITTLSDQELIEEIKLTADLIKDITGQNPVYFRPPRGQYNRDQLYTIRDMGYIPVKWDACLEKRSINNPEQLVDHLINRIKRTPNPVLLLHDGDPSNRHDRTSTVQALPILIENLQEKGYIFADPSESFRLRQVEL